MLNPGLGADMVNGLGGVGLKLLEPVHIWTLVVLALAAAWPWLSSPHPPVLKEGSAEQQTIALSRPLGWPSWLTPFIVLLVLLSLALTVIPYSASLVIALNLVSAGTVVGTALAFACSRSTTPRLRRALGLLGLSFAGYYVYVLLTIVGGLQTTGQSLEQNTLGNIAIWAHFLGEGVAMLWIFALFWAVGPFRLHVTANRTLMGRTFTVTWVVGPLGPAAGGATVFSWPRLAIALVPGLLIAIAPLFETWMQGVLARMSVGFTLFLPTPVYALATVAYVYTLLTCWDRQAPDQLSLPWLRELGAGLILLPVAGFDLLSNYQMTVATVTVLLLTGLIRPISLQPSLGEVRKQPPVSSTQKSKIN